MRKNRRKKLCHLTTENNKTCVLLNLFSFNKIQHEISRTRARGYRVTHKERDCKDDPKSFYVNTAFERLIK